MWQNLKAIWANLPLMVSETDKPEDISMNRFLTFIYALFVVVSPFVVLELLTELAEKFLPYWQGVLGLLGLQTGANMGKKAITAYKEVRGNVDSSN